MYLGAGRDVWSGLGVTMLVGNGVGQSRPHQTSSTSTKWSADSRTVWGALWNKNKRKGKTLCEELFVFFFTLFLRNFYTSSSGICQTCVVH